MSTELKRAPHEPLAPAAWPEIELGASDRILILAPHPDDESLACGGIIQRALNSGLPVHVLFLTNGDNNEWSFMVYRKRPELLPWQVRAMGEVRRGEALAAARGLGLPPDALTFLGYPDFGTLRIWCSHWGDAPPFRSMLTRVTSVPYENAYRRGAAYKGEEIVRDLAAVIREFRPTQIFVSHPADDNPDHAALYLFTRIVLWDLAEDQRPQVHPFLVHYPRWPRPRGQAKGAAIAPPERLSRRCAWTVLRLTGDEVSRKEAALQAHQTQYGYCREYLDSFVRTDELYGDFEDVRLPRADASAGLSLGTDASAAPLEPAEELEEDERARFVGVESYLVQLVGEDLQLSIGLSRRLAPDVTVNLYCFGYRADRPFAAMPKLHVEVGERQLCASPTRRIRCPRAPSSVRREARTIVVRIPLEVIGQPQRVLVNAVTRFGDVPLSSQPWRILELASAEAT